MYTEQDKQKPTGSDEAGEGGAAFQEPQADNETCQLKRAVV